ncbi:MAG: FadR family transcriptional regulator [Desulfobacteraceae bacterium]|nr:FadR family transcriptional regulator [Desulfobacteraceae bacterium]
MPEIKNTGFIKAKKSRIFQDVIDQIQEAILTQRLNQGDKLPPERELCETFNISRGTLREALRVLEYKGLIEIRLGTGGGAIVRSVGLEQFTETLALLIRFGKVSVIDIGGFRAGIEGQIASLAAQKVSDEDIVSLNTLLEKLKEHRDSGVSAWDDFLGVDQQLHREIARISGNALYKYVDDVVHDNISRYFDRYLEVSDSNLAKMYNDLEQLVLAVKKKDCKLAAKIAEKHVSTFISSMREKEAVIAGKQ